MASAEVVAVAVDMEVVVEDMAAVVVEEDTVVVEAAADTNLPDLLTSSTHLLLILLLHLTQHRLAEMTFSTVACLLHFNQSFVLFSLTVAGPHLLLYSPFYILLLVPLTNSPRGPVSQALYSTK